jgi:hypothetical protein
MRELLQGTNSFPFTIHSDPSPAFTHKLCTSAKRILPGLPTPILSRQASLGTLSALARIVQVPPEQTPASAVTRGVYLKVSELFFGTLVHFATAGVSPPKFLLCVAFSGHM